ncbi:hypothetical protein ABZS66_12175 [Dactylosporangium sp. NPDC005572]|uniref:hypothetical protein n=1 Tax=Dactylosporangium sp. NPDC005572 TaxID=3156889 RepID=UPI0033B079EB
MISSQPPAVPDRASEQVPACATRSLTTLAQAQLAHGRRQPAVALLRAALLGVDPITAPPRPDLNAAARLYAETLHAHEHGNWQSLRWARYAHQASTDVFGVYDERTVDAARTLARVLAAYRLDDAAITLRRLIVAQLTDRDGPASPGVLAARMDLAITQHAAGHCPAAIAGLTRTWRQWRRQYGDADLDSVAMVLQLAAMLDACGRYDEAARRTVQAWRAYRTPVSPGGRVPARLSVEWLTTSHQRHAGLCRSTRPPSRLAGAFDPLRELVRALRPGGGAPDHPLRRARTWREFLP